MGHSTITQARRQEIVGCHENKFPYHNFSSRFGLSTKKFYLTGNFWTTLDCNYCIFHYQGVTYLKRYPYQQTSQTTSSVSESAKQYLKAVCALKSFSVPFFVDWTLLLQMFITKTSISTVAINCDCFLFVNVGIVKTCVVCDEVHKMVIFFLKHVY